MKRKLRAIKIAFYKIIGYYSTIISGEKFKLDPCHLYFWYRVKRGHWEPATYDILNKFLNKNSIYIDIGAWIGPTVIFAAKKSKFVYCVEPDYIAYRYLLWNIQLNNLDNVMPFNMALSNTNGIQKMVNLGHPGFGNSQTSLLNVDNNEKSIKVFCMKWADWLKDTVSEKVNFIKMDIEGGEFILLPTMKEYLAKNKPILYLSLHCPYLEKEKITEYFVQIKEIISIYKKCFNEKLEPYSISEEEFANNFLTLLLMD